MRKLICFIALAAVGTVAAAATTTNGIPTSMNPEVREAEARLNASAHANAPGGFARLDANGDGVLTRREAMQDTALSGKFSTLDLNHDGKLDTMEFSQFESTGTVNGSDPNPRPKY